jgi:hypothetical protein
MTTSPERTEETTQWQLLAQQQQPQPVQLEPQLYTNSPATVALATRVLR